MCYGLKAVRGRFPALRRQSGLRSEPGKKPWQPGTGDAETGEHDRLISRLNHEALEPLWGLEPADDSYDDLPF
jgi:hypothetical protein